MHAAPPLFPYVAETGRSAQVLDRALGAFLGLAVGDALGTPLEFSSRDSLPHQTEMTGGGPFHLEPGQWTDDTAMALALADSLVRCDGLDPGHLMARFIALWRYGQYSCTGTCFDIGMLTAQALDRFEASGEVFAGALHERSAGNGSLMRLAPAVLAALDDPEELDRLARDQGRTTHGAPQAIDACALFAAMLREAILGLADPLAPRRFDGHETIAAIAAGSWRGKPRDAIRSSGYVVDTLEAACWAVGSTASFEDALILAINLADDADTVGAVTGQLAGAIYGADAIPGRWIAPLAWRETIVAASRTLLAISQGNRP